MASQPTASGGSVSAEDLARLPEFYNPVVSPGGDRVAFYYDETGRNELYVMDLATGEYGRVTDGEVPRNARWHLVWGAGGDRVYFHRDEAGDEQNDVWAVDLADGEAHRGPDGASGEREVPGASDGERRSSERTGPGAGVEPVIEVDGQGILSDVSGDGRFLLYGSDEGEQLNLSRFDVETGEREQLTAFEQPVWGGTFSPDDDRIAFTANESDRLENRDPYVMASDGSAVRRLDVGEEGAEAMAADWFPGGERLLVGDNSADVDRVGIYDLATDDVEWLSDGEAVESPRAVSPDGRCVLATRQRRAATVPVVYDVETGEGRELDVPEGVASVPLLGGDGVFADERTVVFSHSTPASRKQLYAYDLAADEWEVLLAAAYDDVDPDVFVDAAYVTYESADGLEIGALLYDAREGPALDADATGVPAVVMVHGGPHARSSKGFDLSTQFLVTRGYTVLQPNYRGSTGRGRAFKHAIHDDWGGAEQVDVARGAEWLADREWIDGDRLAVFGGSFGGYSAYCQLTMHPEHWATGVAWVGITDLHRLYEDDMPHFQHMLRQQMGDPEENHDLWRDRSPVEHVERVEAPVFVIHGVNDVRCPIGQARLFRDALEARGWAAGEDFEYEELGEEGHGSTDQDQKLRVLELLGDYLDRRL